MSESKMANKVNIFLCFRFIFEFLDF